MLDHLNFQLLLLMFHKMYSKSMKGKAHQVEQKCFVELQVKPCSCTPAMLRTCSSVENQPVQFKVSRRQLDSS